ncbi:hypothetical protein QNI19_14940 [Cytophagaceae bacterium DM2B3-1]|uniref:Lipoprotein n=1 Tax=Xanthocytophaga flava TaxID=3048013 RepID=A0ABT7CKF8_9BACT|nr:hypothetical protein [Xanthocytophaga flavus]MDJ1494238.1 hypothetical protein [Xanthocytophaga flavus]
MKKLLVLCLLINGFMLTSCNSKQQEKHNAQAISESKVHKGIDYLLTHPSPVDTVREFQIYSYQSIHTHLDSVKICLQEAEKRYNLLSQILQNIKHSDLDEQERQRRNELFQALVDTTLSYKNWLIEHNKIDSICTKYFSHQCRINNRDSTLVITTNANDSILRFDPPQKQK